MNKLIFRLFLPPMLFYNVYYIIDFEIFAQLAGEVIVTSLVTPLITVFL